MTATFEDFLKEINIQAVSFSDFCSRLSVLDVTDKTGNFTVRCNIYQFIDRVVKKDTDTRKTRLNTYLKNLYQMLVTDAEKSLKEWYVRYVGLQESVDFYLQLPGGNCLTDDTFMGMTNSK